MMRIKNKSWSPVSVSLPDGRSLTLPARGTSEVNAEDFQSSELQQLFQSRSVIVLPEAQDKPAGAESKPDKPKNNPPEDGEEDGSQ